MPDTKSSFNLSLPNRVEQGHFKAISSLLHVEKQSEGNLALDIEIWIVDVNPYLAPGGVKLWPNGGQENQIRPNARSGILSMSDARNREVW